jgi:hypothetical protein
MLTCSPVGQTNLQAITRQLMRVSSGQYDITLNLGINNLTDNVGIGEANDEAVLWSIIFVLGLSYKALTSIVIRLALTTTTEFNLISFEVGLVLNKLNKRLQIHHR